MKTIRQDREITDVFCIIPGSMQRISTAFDVTASVEHREKTRSISILRSLATLQATFVICSMLRVKRQVG